MGALEIMLIKELAIPIIIELAKRRASEKEAKAITAAIAKAGKPDEVIEEILKSENAKEGVVQGAADLIEKLLGVLPK